MKRQLSGDKQRQLTVESLVVEGLGYCCLGAFLSLYSNTALIAARLGVSDRIIRMKKQALKEGLLCCRGKPDCLKARGLSLQALPLQAASPDPLPHAPKET